MASLLERLIPALPPELPGAFPSSEPRKLASPFRSPRYRGLYAEHQRRKEAALKRRESLREVAIVETPIPRQGKGRLVGSRNFPFDYPPCPHCDSPSVIRAGIHKGEQRFRCRSCTRSFGGNMKIVRKAREFEVRCHRCGGLDTRGISTSQRAYSGWIGYCNVCRKRFTQGGRHHLDNTMCLLLQRVKALGLPRPLEEAVYQQACLEVLQGFAYTWNVRLDVPRAKAEVLGEFQSPGVRKTVELKMKGAI